MRLSHIISFSVCLSLSSRPVPSAADTTVHPQAPTVAHAVECSVPAAMRWEPSWRGKSDCGPISLYVLMRLLGSDTSIERVKEAIQVDLKRGSNIDSLRSGASKLGFATEVRFVSPGDLSRLRCPYIIHGAGGIEKGTGHFLVVCAYSAARRQFAVINTSTESFGWVPESSVLRLFSGYVLLPQNSEASWMRRLTGCVLLCCGLLTIVARRKWRRATVT